MNPILLTELKAIMSLLESLSSIPVPAPVLPTRVEVPETERWESFPYKDEEFAYWLAYGWTLLEEQVEVECGPGTPLYEYYIQNRLYPRLLEAAYHYVSEVGEQADEIGRLALETECLPLWLVFNIVLYISEPDSIGVDSLSDPYGFEMAEKIMRRVQGFVDAMFNYDLLNVRHMAFRYGERLRLYTCTQQGWAITQLGETLRNLPDAEAAAFLVMLETARALLDQDDWFVSRQRLRWLLDESPICFDIYARDEEGEFKEALKRDDGWLRRLRWLDVAVYTHGYKSVSYDSVLAFNSRTAELTSYGQAVAEAVLASWNNEPGKPSMLSLLDDVQSLGLAPIPAGTISEEVAELREMMSDLHILVGSLQADFGKAQRSFAQRLSDLADEVQKDQAYQEVYEELHQLVVRSLAQVDDRIREYDSRLASRLGETWSQLGQKSRDFLSSAEYLYSEHRGTHALDFAPAAVEYCKVVEWELRKRLIDSLADHLNMKKRWLSLGRLACILEGSQGRKRHDRAVEFVSERYSRDVREFILNDLPDDLLRITRKYRNGAAHAERLLQNEVEEFRDLLLGTEDGTTPSLLQRIVQIQPVQ